MVYRDVLAEVRRLHSAAPWRLTGVVVNGEWSPASPGIGQASMRQIEAGLVEVVRLPRFIATDDQAAVAVAIDVARMRDIEEADPDGSGPRWHEVRTG